MSAEREHIDRVARELRHELTAATQRIWARVEDPEALREIIQRHPLISTGVSLGGGFLSGRLIRAVIARPRLVLRRLLKVAKGVARQAGASAFLVARELAKSPKPPTNGVHETPTPSAKR